jgi:mannosyltransferase
MATVTAPRRSPKLPESFDLKTPNWLERIPPALVSGGVVAILMLISLFLRTRYISGQFWMDEALSVGISSHSLSAIPGVLRMDGSPPLYYLLLHVWMSVFGNTETDTHWLSLVFGMLAIPLGAWAAQSLFGRRAGWIAAVLFALNPFITAYSQETRMYTIMVVWGLLATVGLIQGFVYRRRKFLIMYALAQAVMLYTHAWGIFFGVGAVVSLIPVYLHSEERRALLKDAVFSFGAAGILFLPWLPTLLFQAANTGSPWDSAPNFGAPVQISRNLMGGDRATTALVLAACIGLASYLFSRKHWRSKEAQTMWLMILLPVGTLGCGWLVSRFSPAWQYRYFAPILPALLLLFAWGLARAKGVGLVALLLTVIFWANPSSYVPQYKSDMKDVGAEMAGPLRPGDLVIVGQPEQTPLAWYYLPGGLRFANTTGAVSDPRHMNWVHALSRLQHANPQATLAPMLASLKPGQHVLYLRPLTEGANSWEAPWTQLVRRRSAQWGAILAADKSLKLVAVAPHNYRSACCVADQGSLYVKT